MLGIMACQPSQSASTLTSGQVNAEDYDSFWVWGNISSAPYLKTAKEIYILQGEVRLHPQTHHSYLIPQGVQVLNIPQQKVWLVFRNYHLNWQGHELTQILKRVQQWENAGNHIQGIQIDFDAKTTLSTQYHRFNGLDQCHKSGDVKAPQ